MSYRVLLLFLCCITFLQFSCKSMTIRTLPYSWQESTKSTKTVPSHPIDWYKDSKMPKLFKKILQKQLEHKKQKLSEIQKGITTARKQKRTTAVHVLKQKQKELQTRIQLIYQQIDTPKNFGHCSNPQMLTPLNLLKKKTRMCVEVIQDHRASGQRHRGLYSTFLIFGTIGGVAILSAPVAYAIQNANQNANQNTDKNPQTPASGNTNVAGTIGTIMATGGTALAGSATLALSVFDTPNRSNTHENNSVTINKILNKAEARWYTEVCQAKTLKQAFTASSTILKELGEKCVFDAPDLIKDVNLLGKIQSEQVKAGQVLSQYQKQTLQMDDMITYRNSKSRMQLLRNQLYNPNRTPAQKKDLCRRLNALYNQMKSLRSSFSGNNTTTTIQRGDWWGTCEALVSTSSQETQGKKKSKTSGQNSNPLTGKNDPKNKKK